MELKKIGPFIQEIDIRNIEGKKTNLLGVSVNKTFIPSIANTVGTDWTKYKIIKKNQFCYIPDTSRRGDKIGIALLKDYDEALVSQAYTVFSVDESQILPDYLLLWFMRSEFDRYARFHSHGSVREIFDWNKLSNVELPQPSIKEQQKIVDEYNSISERIAIKEAINNNLLQQITEILKTNKIESVISLREFPSLVEISSGIKKFVANKKYFATGDINNGRFLSSYELISYKNRPSRANMQPVNNSIWFAKMQFTKKTVYFDNNIDNKTQDRILSTGFMGVQCDQKYLYYLLAFILSDDFEAQKDKFATGTTQIAINSSVIDKIMIPFEEIVAVKLSYKFEKIFNKIQVNNNELEKLEILKNILITKLATQQ